VRLVLILYIIVEVELRSTFAYMNFLNQLFTILIPQSYPIKDETRLLATYYLIPSLRRYLPLMLDIRGKIVINVTESQRSRDSTMSLMHIAFV